MTSIKILKVSTELFEMLRAKGIDPERQCTNFVMYNRTNQLEHCGWMLQEIGKMLAQNKIEKCNRWLGFVQGVLWSQGLLTIDQMKEQNRDKSVSQV